MGYQQGEDSPYHDGPLSLVANAGAVERFTKINIHVFIHYNYGKWYKEIHSIMGRFIWKTYQIWVVRRGLQKKLTFKLRFIE